MAKTYDPAQILVIVGGVPISGYADGTFVKVAFNEDAWTLQVGADGEGARSKSNNRSGSIEISLLQTSDSNRILSGFATADRVGNLGVVPVLVKDASGTSIHEATTAWVKKVADVEYGKEATARTWVLETDKLVSFVGGNS